MTRARREVLVVAATRAEAAAVPDDVDLLVTGIGKTFAAAATAARLARHGDPAAVEVINLGTAGSLRDGVTGLHLPGAVLNHDLDAASLRSLGYDPQERLGIDGGDPAITLATGDEFVSDPDERAVLARQATLVDMEGYAVAWAARSLGAACTLVKHVSDSADESAWDWPAQVAASAAVLGEWLRTRLA